MNTKRVLISGGFGYIGSCLVQHLRSKGYAVGILARSIPAHFSDIAGDVDVYLCDISQPINCNLRQDYDLFIHLAAANDIDSKNPELALGVTVLGTRHCLDFCRRNKIKQFVYFSTFQVYGIDSGYVDENTPVRPKNEYAITHFFAEEYVKMYQRQWGIHTLILRPVNIYGAFIRNGIDRWSLVPGCFCLEAYKNKQITLLSSGRQIKDFISIHDLCGITELLCRRFQEERNKIFNVTKGFGLSILEIAQITQKAYQKLFGQECKMEIRSNEPEKSEPLIVSGDEIGKLNYNFSGKNSLEEEINKTFHLLMEAEIGSY